MTNKEDKYHKSDFETVCYGSVEIFDINRLHDHITVYGLKRGKLRSYLFGLLGNRSW